MQRRLGPYPLGVWIALMAIGVYFPLFFAFQRWSTFRGTVIFALLLWAVPSLLGIAGLWANRREFRDGAGDLA